MSPRGPVSLMLCFVLGILISRGPFVHAVGRAPFCRQMLPVKGIETVKEDGKIDVKLDCLLEGGSYVPIIKRLRHAVAGKTVTEIFGRRWTTQDDGDIECPSESTVKWFRTTTSGERIQIADNTENYGMSVTQLGDNKIYSLIIENLRIENYGLYFCDNAEGTCDAEFPVYGRECQVLRDGRDYMGTKNMTSSGKTCQRWDSNVPHSIPEYIRSMTTGQENYCRYPDFKTDDIGSPWCYTMDPETRYEACDIQNCVSPEITLSVLVNGKVAEIKDNTVWTVPPGSNLTFICSATGEPEPHLRWYTSIYKWTASDHYNVFKRQRGGIDFIKGSNHTITNFTRSDYSAQTCVADNAAFPPVHKRVGISLKKKPSCFKAAEPTVEVIDGKSVVKISCVIGGDPKPDVAFYKKNRVGSAEMVLYNDKYRLETKSWYNSQAMVYTLVINDLTPSYKDYGLYYCHAKNEVGECPFLSTYTEFKIDGNI